jgi:hypothetical protein
MSEINFTLKSFALSNTRSLHEDTNYLALALTQNEKQLPPQVRKIGNVNNGTKQVNMTISISGTYKTADTFTFSYILINHGGGSTEEVSTHCLNAISSAPMKNFSTKGATPVSVSGTQLPMCLSTALRAKDDMNASWNLIKSFFQHMDTNHCDGPVAIDSFSFTGAELDNLILVSQATPFSIIYLGTDSAIGCGSNSDYSVQWQVGVS